MACDADTDGPKSKTSCIALFCCGLFWARVDRSCYTGLSEQQLGEIPLLKWHRFVWIHSSISQTGGSRVWDNYIHRLKPHDFRFFYVILIYTYFLFYISCLKEMYRVIKNHCRGFKNLYKMHLRWEYMYFLFNRTKLQVFVTYLTGALYVHPLWFYKHQHDNRVRFTQNAFSLRFAAILVNCAPSGEMHNYCTPQHHKRKLWEFLDPSVQLHTPIPSVLCMTSC